MTHTDKPFGRRPPVAPKPAIPLHRASRLKTIYIIASLIGAIALVVVLL